MLLGAVTIWGASGYHMIVQHVSWWIWAGLCLVRGWIPSWYLRCWLFLGYAPVLLTRSWFDRRDGGALRRWVFWVVLGNSYLLLVARSRCKFGRGYMWSSGLDEFHRNGVESISYPVVRLMRWGIRLCMWIVRLLVASCLSTESGHRRTSALHLCVDFQSLNSA